MRITVLKIYTAYVTIRNSFIYQNIIVVRQIENSIELYIHTIEYINK